VRQNLEELTEANAESSRRRETTTNRQFDCTQNVLNNATQRVDTVLDDGLQLRSSVVGVVVKRSKADGGKVNLVSAFSLPALVAANSLFLKVER